MSIVRRGAGWLVTGIDRVATGFRNVGALVIFLLMFVVAYAVVMRYLFRESLPWALEISQFLNAAVIFFPLAYVLAKGRHIVCDFVTSHLSRTIQAGLALATLLIALVFFAVFTWASGVAAWEAYQLNLYSSGAMPMPLAPVRTVVPLGCFLLCLQLIVEISRCLRSLLARGGAEL